MVGGYGTFGGLRRGTLFVANYFDWGWDLSSVLFIRVFERVRL